MTLTRGVSGVSGGLLRRLAGQPPLHLRRGSEQEPGDHADGVDGPAALVGSADREDAEDRVVEQGGGDGDGQEQEDELDLLGAPARGDDRHAEEQDEVAQRVEDRQHERREVRGLERGDGPEHHGPQEHGSAEENRGHVQPELDRFGPGAEEAREGHQPEQERAVVGDVDGLSQDIGETRRRLVAPEPLRPEPERVARPEQEEGDGQVSPRFPRSRVEARGLAGRDGEEGHDQPHRHERRVAPEGAHPLRKPDGQGENAVEKAPDAEPDRQIGRPARRRRAPRRSWPAGKHSFRRARTFGDAVAHCSYCRRSAARCGLRGRRSHPYFRVFR